MSQADFVIIDTSGSESTWEESSPQDPTQVTVTANGRATIRSAKDNGPWTVNLTSYGGQEANGGVIFNDNSAGTTATICLTAGAMGLFNVNLPG